MGGRWVWLAAAAGVAVAMIAACADDDDSSSRSSRCVTVAGDLVAGIETGLTVSGGGTLRRPAFAVRSGDFERVWFVAAEIDGSGMEGGGQVGVWATNRDPAVGASSPGLIFAADGLAREFSDWGEGPGFSITDDGAREARDCVN